MGGSAGKVVGRGLLAGATGGISEFGQANPFGAPVKNPINPIASDLTKHLGLNLFPNATPGQASAYSNFGIDPNQSGADQAAINSLGQQQYQDTKNAIYDTGTAETQRAKDLFAQTLPNIAENSQAAHLYDSTGYGQEVARQQSNIASQVAEKEAQQKLGALQGLQGFQTGALQRGQSLEDFSNQANVAQAIGAKTAPLPPNGKQNFGTVAQGVGALSPFAKLGKASGAAAPAAGSLTGLV